MLRLRIVYEEELVALRRLFFMTEGRNLNDSDLILSNGWLTINTNISDELLSILQKFETETIWAPLWVSGISRGFFSNEVHTAMQLSGISSIPDIRWLLMYKQIVFVDRNDYMETMKFVNNYVGDRIFLQDSDIKRLVVGGINESEAIGSFYKVPKGTTVNMMESYLLGSNFFVLPCYENLKHRIMSNYMYTKSNRVPGGRSILNFPNNECAVVLDSYDELSSLLENKLEIKYSSKKYLQFLPNSSYQGDKLDIWMSPFAVGDENIYIELSYYRETGNIDKSYYKYRDLEVKNMNDTKQNSILSLISSLKNKYLS